VLKAVSPEDGDKDENPLDGKIIGELVDIPPIE